MFKKEQDTYSRRLVERFLGEGFVLEKKQFETIDRK